MKKSWAALMLALLACQPAAEQRPAEAGPPAQQAVAPVKAELFEGTALGEPITLEYLTPVADILARPDEYVGQRVLVDGVIAAVCQKQGCWMDIMSGAAADTIQVKVDDGVIVFPKDAAGHKVLAEGTVEKLDLTREQAIAAGEEKARESGGTFDAASVTGPVTVYRIRGLGVLIAA